MKLGSFVTGLIVVIAAGVAAPPLPAVADQLGTAWHVREGADWNATWTRRGTSNVFDGVSTHRYTLKKITAVLTTTVKGSAVSIQRRNGSDGVDVNYTGAIGGDGTTVKGTARVLPNGVPFGWEARIVGGTGSSSGAATPPPPSSPVPPGPPPAALSLTGSWVHSADPTFKTHDSKVIVIQNGTQVTMTRAAKYKGRWIVSLCRGVLSGNTLRAECDYAPGGNPFGFAATIESWVVSQDGNHLDGAIAGVHESHYSRIP